MITKPESPIWCQKPFVEINTDGVHAKPCCLYQRTSLILIENYSKNKEIRDVRQQILDGQAPIQCKACTDNEKLSGKSLRTQSNNFDAFDTDLSYYTVDNDIVLNLLVMSSNVCNLRCIHCSPDASYARGVEMYKLKLIDQKPKLVESDLGHLKQIKFQKITITGGEPFYDKRIISFLQELPFSRDTSQIEIDINTNLTHVTSDLLLFFVSHYKKLQIKASIDGFRESNDYLRYPSQWKDIEAAIDVIKSIPEIELCVTSSISNLSLIHLPYLIEWTVAKGIRNHYFSMVNKPAELDPRKLSKNIRHSLLPKFAGVKNAIDRDYHDRTVELIDGCINLCELESSEDNSLLVDYLRKHDEERNTNFALVWPELITEA